MTYDPTELLYMILDKIKKGEAPKAVDNLRELASWLEAEGEAPDLMTALRRLGAIISPYIRTNRSWRYAKPGYSFAVWEDWKGRTYMRHEDGTFRHVPQENEP